MTQASGHEHVFRQAHLRYDDGALIDGGRRCACGLEVVGDGPFAVNASVVRAARSFNQACAAAVERFAAAVEAANRRRFP